MCGRGDTSRAHEYFSLVTHPLRAGAQWPENPYLTGFSEPSDTCAPNVAIHPADSRGASSAVNAGAHQHGVSEPLNKETTMFTKTVIALVLILGTASGALAQKRHSTNPAHDVFDITGKYVGSDPDANVRFMLQR